MTARILYQVNEFQAGTNEFLSQIQTLDPYLALSDFMIKAHLPVGHTPMRHPRSDPLYFETYPVFPEFAAQGPLNMGWTAIDQETKKPVLIATINCVEASDLSIESVHPASIERYRNESYVKALVKLRERVVRWSDHDIDAACILAACSILDSSHLFWDEMKKKPSRGLGY
ncbi:hypothetical protein RYA05_05580 [Pseudomonas syringae pv. actinidiae]|nr:hypothetical protein [Pseudomonas syringae pv. actinidiae]